MVKSGLLKYLYPFYHEANFYLHKSAHPRWLTPLYCFLIFTIIELFPSSPKKVFAQSPKYDVLDMIYSIIFFLPYLYGTDSLLYDSIIWFVISFIISIIFFAAAYRSYLKKWLPSWLIHIICFFQQSFFPILVYPLIFRIGYLLQRVPDFHDVKTIIAICFSVINLLILVFHHLLVSIFLLPFTFVSTSKFDVYEGKSSLLLLFTQIFFEISILIVPFHKSSLASGLVFIIQLLLLVLILYKRILTLIHVSLIGQYFELSPLFCSPFMFVTHSFGNFEWIGIVIIFLLLHVVFLIIMHLAAAIMKDLSFRTFAGYIYNDSTIVNIPNFIPGKISTLIRIIAKNNSDPHVLGRYMVTQQANGIRTSTFIELCRFISIFPEYRATMLEELKRQKSNSMHNEYTLSLFELILESLPKDVDSSELGILDDYSIKYGVHSYLYWKARKDKKYLTAFAECGACAYLHSQIESVLYRLMNQYPLSPTLYQITAETVLSINGDFEMYKRFRHYSRSLTESIDSVIDPLLHQSGISNPKILQFAKQTPRSNRSEYDSSSSNHTVLISIPSLHFKSSSATQSSQKQHKKMINIVGSKIVKYTDKSQYLHYLHYILPCFLLFILITLCIPNDSKFISKNLGIVDSLLELMPLFYRYSASILGPYIFLSNKSTDNYTDIEECQSLYFQIAKYVNDFFHNSTVFSSLSSTIIEIVYNELTNPVNVHMGDICDVLTNMPEQLVIYFNRSRNDLFDQEEMVEELFAFPDEKTNQGFSLVYGSILIVIVLVVYTIIFYILITYNLNTILKNDKSAIDFLSSKKRIVSIIDDIQDRKNYWHRFKPTNALSTTSDSSQPFQSEPLATQNRKMITAQKNMSSVSSMLSFTSATSSSNILQIPKVDPEPVDSLLNISHRLPSTNFESADTSESDFEEKTPMKLVPKFRIGQSSFTGSGLNVLRQPRTFEAQDSKLTEQDSADISSARPHLHSYDSQNDSLLNSESCQIEKAYTASSHSPRNENRISELRQYLETFHDNVFKYNFLLILETYFAWILALLLCLLALFPYEQRLGNVENYLVDFQERTSEVKQTYLLLNALYDQFMTGQPNIEFYNSFIESICYGHGYISKQCQKEICYGSDSDLFCFSVESIIGELLSNSSSIAKIEEYYLPHLLAFSQNSTQALLIDQIYSIKWPILTNNWGFLVCYFVLMIAFLVITFRLSMKIGNGFFSLFHFPKFEDRTEEKAPEDLNLNKLKKVPSNVIIVTSLTETDEIYSISDNSQQIINQKTSELICRKFSKTFPITSKNNSFEIRENNGKSFIAQSKTVGTLTKTILIEQAKNETRAKSANIQKLINFMPNYFAKFFSEKFINSFHFDKSYLIFVRIDPKAEQIDAFVNNLHNKVEQMYFGMEFLRSNGSILTFISHEIDDLATIMFIRDIIIQAEETSKKQPNKYAPKSIFVDIVKELNVHIMNSDSEPYLDIEEKEFARIEAIPYLVDDHCLGGSKNTFLKLRIFSDSIERKQFDNSYAFLSISFKNYMEEIET